MSHRNAIGALVAVALSIVALPSRATATPPTTSGERDRQSLRDQLAPIVDANNRFAFDLYERVRDHEGNLFFSPASNAMVLAMAYAGAAGDTQAEMAKVLHFTMPKAQVSEQLRALRTSWNMDGEKGRFQLVVANRLWGQQGHHYLAEFVRATRNDYGAELGRLDFRNAAEHSRLTINAWIRENTAQKITNLISSSEALNGAQLVLTNAVYFKSRWHSPFKKEHTKNADFEVSVDRKTTVPTMFREDDFGYARVEGLELLELGYGGLNASMVVLLPERGKLSQLEEKLTATNLRTWIERLVSQEVIVYLPKFKITSQFQLDETLKSMGMVSAFDAGTADFSGMTGRRGLFLSAVIRKAFVDVNEEGTEAAAATLGQVGSPDEPKVFRADHPFVFLIRDNRTGVILFLGRIVDPTN